MTPCSICHRNPAATAQGLCGPCATSATAVAQPAAQPAPPGPAYGYGNPAAASYPPPAYGAAPYGAPMPFAPAPPRVTAPVGLSYAVIALLGVYVLAALLSVGASLNLASVAEDMDVSPFSVTKDDADDADALMALAIVFRVLVVIVTGILFIIWFAIARGNAAAFAPQIDKWGKGFAVGGWFIPFACVAIPRLVAGATWEASRRNPYAPKSEQPRTILTVWWTLCIVSYLAWQGTVMNYDKAETPGALKSAAYGLVFADLLSVAAAVMAIFVVRKITRMQVEKIAMGWQPAMPIMPTMPRAY
ncbi:DUF4328 domain-containing protein [Streptomyces sp. NPDC058953]|uniref:DUF4328 domain-containing protein n=1 Tax=unclassified Streptomyces TaxID=2593676 RepID=UPI00367D128A